MDCWINLRPTWKQCAKQDHAHSARDQRSSRLHQVADQPPNLLVPHAEYMAKHQVQESAILVGGSHGTLRHHDIVFLGQPADGDQGWPTNPSSTMCLAKSSLPRTSNAPGITHSTSSVRQDRICGR